MDLEIKVNPKIEDEGLSNLLKQYRYGRYCEDPSLPIEMSHKFILDSIKAYLAHDDAQCVAVFSFSGEILGMATFKISKWDTDHFGYRVAIIDSIIIKESDYFNKLNVAGAILKQLHLWCKTSNVRFVSIRVSALDLSVIHSLEQCGFGYIGSRIYNKYDLDSLGKFKKRPYKLRLASSSDLSKMVHFAKGAFVTQRFHADPCIPQDKAESLYEKWISTAFTDHKQKILVLDIKNKPAAFMVYYKNDLRKYFNTQFAMWKLCLVDPEKRGKGLGFDFFTALMYYHRKEGLDIIDSGISMRNLASFRLHNKHDFKVISTCVTFHKWLGT